MATSPAEQARDAGDGRLCGWREIAVHLGKGLRTAQRWEKLYGLPVHRDGNEAVFAYADELDRWVRDTTVGRAADGEADEARDAAAGVPAATNAGATRPRRATWPRAAVAAGVLLFACAVAGWAGRAALHWRRTPASWTIEKGALVVFDGGGRPLFSHALAPDAPRSYAPPANARVDEQPVRFADVDGDGRTEVLFTPPAPRFGRDLYCFDAAGALRFVHGLTRRVRFGGVEYTPPWAASRFSVVPRADQTHGVWAIFVHHTWYPSAAQELGPDGRVRAEFWSDGHIAFVRELSLGGRELVLIGGTNNELRGASLAVFDRGRVGGHAPASNAAYACEDCPPGGPREYLVFPASCLWRRQASGASAIDARLEGDALVLTVDGGDGTPLSIDAGPATRIEYRLDAALRLQGVRIDRDFQQLHAAFEQRRLLDHPFGGRDDENLFPVLRHAEGAFAPLPPVPVTH